MTAHHTPRHLDGDPWPPAQRVTATARRHRLRNAVGSTTRVPAAVHPGAGGPDAGSSAARRRCGDRHVRTQDVARRADQLRQSVGRGVAATPRRTRSADGHLDHISGSAPAPPQPSECIARWPPPWRCRPLMRLESPPVTAASGRAAGRPIPTQALRPRSPRIGLPGHRHHREVACPTSRQGACPSLSRLHARTSNTPRPSGQGRHAHRSKSRDLPLRARCRPSPRPGAQ